MRPMHSPSMKVLTHLYLLIGASNAFQFPFAIPFFSKVPAVEVEPILVNETARIAIIGAGAGGSSAAYWISRAQERFGLEVEVDVYERQSYIGGRSTVVYPYDDPRLPPIELGASIFVAANKNLWRASDEFNLTRQDFSAEDNDLGVWDGQNILIAYSGSWWDTLKLVWRYGVFSPRRAEAIVKAMLNRFLTLYSSETPKWDDIAHLTSELEWTDLVAQSTYQYLQSNGVGTSFLNEFIDASTRVNYGQNVDEIHTLEGLCSMAAEGAVGIKEGNFRLFEEFLKRSGAHVHLNTTVLKINHQDSSHDWTVETTSGTKRYRGVILAAPFHQTKISLPESISASIQPQPYIRLHVTLLVTSSPSFNPVYFGQRPGTHVPKMMLTTYDGVRKGGKEPEFNSISYHGKISEDEWAVKIFSKQRVSDEWLERIFPNSVKWVYRKEWDAYPVLPPTKQFPPVKLDTGFYYVNAFEPLISTMETETIASRNAVDLLLNDRFSSSVCGPRLSSSETPEFQSAFQATNTGDFVFGWDC